MDYFELAKKITDPRPLPLGTGKDGVLVLLAELHTQVKEAVETCPVSMIASTIDDIFSEYRRKLAAL